MKRARANIIITTTVIVAAALPIMSASEFEHPFETDATRAPSLETGGSCLIRGATVHTAVATPLAADVLVRDGKIVAIGDGLEAPDGVVVIDAAGYHLAPGVIDVHSHLATDGGTNEGTLSITADCDITDVIDADDVGLYRALAGGVTAIQVLHGSANTIGGRSEVLKLKQGRTADELRFPDAPQGIKFALGENVKRSGQDGRRFPGTRMGIETLFERAFQRALEYRAEWQAYGEAVANGERPTPPRRDLRLEVLDGVLQGDVQVHSHCYRADEILMLLRIGDRYGFRVQTLQHVLEGYKVADEIARHGAGGSSFSDWWAYKIEAYDAIPQNAALMDEAGVLTTVNSDSSELIRHLYHEAGKSIRYGGMDPVRALRLVTLNAAKQLGVGHRAGSIEVGKDADLALLTHEPLSAYGRVEWTMVDGEVEFQRVDAFGFDDEPLAEVMTEEPARVADDWTPPDGPLVAITGGTVHPVTGPDIEGGTVLIQGGVIVDVTDAPPPAGARVVDVGGRHVWPGIIALNTPVGLIEIGSVRETNDTREIGGNQPDVRVSAAINHESRHIGATRAAGVTRSQTAPQGGGPIMGQSAVIALDGTSWEELVLVDRDMLHVAFPRASNTAKKKEMPESVKELTRMLAEAREYRRLSDVGDHAAPRFDPRLDALAPYALGEKRVAIHASNAQTILFALQFLKGEPRLDPVLYGCLEGWKVRDAIAASGLPVVVGPVLRVPSSRYDPYDSCYANAAVLHRAGVPIAIMADDEENTRNAPFAAAFAAAYGLPRQVALEAVTYRAAAMLGLEDRLGSLQRGKIADIVVTDGDLLETGTQVLDLWVGGRRSTPRNAQTELYERYRARMLRMRDDPDRR